MRMKSIFKTLMEYKLSRKFMDIHCFYHFSMSQRCKKQKNKKENKEKKRKQKRSSLSLLSCANQQPSMAVWRPASKISDFNDL